MLRSMYSAISGMQSFETKLDVIGNNIANVDTPGFKSGVVDFSDVLSQTVAGGSAPSTTSGGINPQQIGLGVKASGIATLFTQGADQSTGNPLDLAINGGGLFVVSPDGGNHLYYSRAGDFSVDSGGNLVLPNGSVALGYHYANVSTTSGGTTTYSSQVGTSLKPMNLQGMLNDYVSSLNNTTDAGGTYTVTGPDQVTYTPTSGTAQTYTYALASNPDVQIGADGSLAATVQVTNTTASPNTVTTERLPLGNLALATVSNPGGLEKVGDSMYITSNNSGQPTYQMPGQNNTGSVESGYLEMSNVDLTREFTEMIVAQRGFDANSKMIGTDNAILNDIVNLKNG